MKKLFNRKAFTLLETLAATSILVLSVIGPLTVMIDSSTYARKAKEELSAKYLAEESVELLQNHADSIYIFCRKNLSDPLCVPAANETIGGVAWRTFKQRLESPPTNCLSVINGSPVPGEVSGCSFDFISMTNASMPTGGIAPTTPALYNAAEVGRYLVGAGTVETVRANTGVRFQIFVTSETASTNAIDMSKLYKRKVTIEHMPTNSYESSLAMTAQYRDDLRVTSEISYTGKNGRGTYSIVKYIHPFKN